MTPLAYWSIAWIVGIWLGSLWALPSYAWAAGAVVALVAAMSPCLAKARLFLGCALFLALGATRLILAQPHFDDRSLATYNDRGEATLVGVVAAEPQVRDKSITYKLDAESLTFEGTEGEPTSVQGAALVSGPRYPVYAYGDRLQVTGRLETPPVREDFSYRDYLARKSIYSHVPWAQVERLGSGEGSAWKRTLLDVKGRAQRTIARILPEPEASLLTGILLGADSGIPDETMEAFAATGTTHVIVISGFNITIVAGVLMATLGRAMPDRRLAAGVAILGVIIYTILVGGDAAVVRAAVMGIVTIIGVAVGRPGLAYNSLAFAALVMTALNPFTLWDVGFQLSVCATLGLILYAGRFEERVQRLLARRFAAERAKQVAGWIGDAVLLTLAAQIMTTPLILKYFGRLSLVSLLSNALILLVQPYIMFFGGTAALAGLLIEPLGRAIGWAAYLPLTWTIHVVEWTARMPYASIPFQLSDWGLAGVYVLIGAATLVALMAPERRRALWEGLRSSVPVTAGLGGLAVLTVIAWVAVLQFPDDKLHVTFMDVGQGDAIFIESPGGAQILVDGGPAGSTVLAELGRQMPFWDRTLDLVVLTHPDADHLTGLVPVLERYGVQALMFRDPLGEDDLADAWRTAVAAEGATLLQGEAGTRLELSDGLTLEVLHPGPAGEGGDDPNTNNESLVLRLTYEEVAFLLPGDIEADVEQALVRSGAYLRSSVLKVPHHGAKTSACQAFLEAVSPQVAVISVGADNRFGHPSEEALERLEGALVYRTDRNGTVAVASDGQSLWIEAER